MDSSQYKLLKTCSEKKDMTDWNIFRLNNSEEKIDFKFISLEKFYLYEANLKNVDLRFSSLTNVKLNGAEVSDSKILTYFFFLKAFAFIFVISMTLLYFYTNNSYSDYFTNIKEEYYKVNFVNSLISFCISIIILDIILSSFSIKSVYESFFKEVLYIFVKSCFSFFLLSLFIVILSFFLFESIETSIILNIVLLTALVISSIRSFIRDQNISLSYSKNPDDVIGFDSSFLLKTKESEELKNELSKNENEGKEQEKIREKLLSDENLSADSKELFSSRLEILENQRTMREEREEDLRKRIDIVEKQEDEIELIKRSMNEIKESFSYIYKTEKSYFKMTIIYSLFLIVGIVMLGYFANLSYETRMSTFLSLKEINFSASLGIILFYATPIMFSFVIIIYSMLNIQKNIKEQEKLLNKRYQIELLESTFYAQINIGFNGKEAMQKLIQKLADSAYEKIFDANNIENISTNSKKRYIDKINEKKFSVLLSFIEKYSK